MTKPRSKKPVTGPPTQPIVEANFASTEKIASKAIVNAISDLTGFKHESHFQSLVSYLSANLHSHISNREWYFNELSGYRNNYLVNGIYDIVINDVLVDNGTTDFLVVSCEKYPEVEEELRAMFNKLNINNVLTSIFPDLLHNGSYPLRPVVKTGIGVVDLIDNLEPRQVLAVCDSKNNPLMYYISNTLRKNPTTDGTSYVQGNYNQKAAYEYLDITELVYFSTDLNFSKLNIPERDIRTLKQKTPLDGRKLLPNALKIKQSQSFVWPVLDKLKEVLLLDKLSVYRDIGSILTPNLIGLPVPDTYDPNQLIELVKKYDELLNSNVVKINNAQSLEITLQELASVKVIPIVGDRSTPQQVDVGRSVPISSIEALNDSLSRLLNALGIPKELFDGAMESKSNIKTNIRYAKKIKRIQKNISRTLISLCLLHVCERFPSLNVLDSDIHIQLRNNMNLDELENMESQDLIVASISSMKELIENLEPIVEKSSYEIDVDAIVETIKDSFSSMGSKYATIFRKKEVKLDAQIYTNKQDIQQETEAETAEPESQAAEVASQAEPEATKPEANDANAATPDQTSLSESNDMSKASDLTKRLLKTINESKPTPLSIQECNKIFDRISAITNRIADQKQYDKFLTKVDSIQEGLSNGFDRIAGYDTEALHVQQGSQEFIQVVKHLNKIETLK